MKPARDFFLSLFRIVLLAGVALFLASCQTTNALDPDGQQESVRDHIEIYPAGENSPAVFLLQGSGPVRAHRHWAKWFARHGVSAILIDSAGMRGRKRFGGMHVFDYGQDVPMAMKMVRDTHPEIDLTRFAVMGFSRGATVALKSARHFTNGARPSLIFALYPGVGGQCPNSYGNSVETHIFYGNLDDWGTYQGNRAACQRTASKYERTFFHLLDNAHHGFDGQWEGTWYAANRAFHSKPNPEAKKTTEAIILEAMHRVWGRLR